MRRFISTIFLSILFLGIHLNCQCPPISTSIESIQHEFQEAEDVIAGFIFNVDIANELVRIQITDVFKGELNSGDTIVMSTDEHCSGFLNEVGSCVLFGRMATFFLRSGCDLSFNVDNPHLLPPPPPPAPGTKGVWKTMDDPEWKRDNQEFATKIQKQLTIIRTVPK